jgi:hypothetical protein
LRAALCLIAVLSLGFAVDALMLVRGRVKADGSAAASQRAQGVSLEAEPPRDLRSTAPDQEAAASAGQARAVRPSPWRRLAKGASPTGSEAWSVAMIAITLVLAVCGGLIAAGRRFLPRSAGGAVKVISRVSLSPKHSVYLLEVGRRRLLVGAGPQGAPALISELDELADIGAGPSEGGAA